MHGLTRVCLERPLTTLAAVAVVTAIALVGLARLRTEVGYRAFLGSAHPSVKRLDAFVARYGGGLPVAAVWTCRETDFCRTVFDPAALRMTHEVSDTLRRVPGVRAVESPGSSQLLVPSESLYELRRFVERGEVVADRSALATIAMKDPLWRGTLVSDDMATGAIVVDLGSSDTDTSVAAFAALQDALEPYERQGVRFRYVGGPVEFVVAGAQLAADLRVLVPIMVGLVGACLLVLFRSLTQALAVLAVVGLALLWTRGLLGWMGWPQTSITEVLGPLVLTVGVCNAIHLLAHYNAGALAHEGNRKTRRAAVDAAAADVGAACAMTTLTTAAALMSFGPSRLASMTQFGLASAAGVAAALLLTFTALPLVLVYLPSRSRSARADSGRWQAGLARVVDTATRRRRPVLAVTALIAVAGVAGTARLQVDASFEDLYGRDSDVVTWANFVRENLRSPDTLEVEMVAPPGKSIADPVSLRTLSELETRFERLEGLERARSIATILEHAKRTADMLEAPDAPESERLSLNTMLLDEYSRLHPTSYRLWVRPDRRAARISIEAEKLPQDRLRTTLAAVDEVLSSSVAQGWRANVTGPLAVVGEMIDDLRRTQLQSFALAFAVVFALLTVLLRSPAWAALGMLPTALPVVTVIGMMGLAGLHLDVGGAMVGAIVIGICDDDTIHLLAHYRESLARGYDPPSAITRAALHIGRAVATTSLALILGFGSLLFSSWQSIASFGLLSGLVIAFALGATLIVLPAAVHVVAGRHHARAPTRVAA